jgi:thiamine biosynthesis lipoprotein ApbE
MSSASTRFENFRKRTGVKGKVVVISKDDSLEINNRINKEMVESKRKFSRKEKRSHIAAANLVLNA